MSDDHAVDRLILRWAPNLKPSEARAVLATFMRTCTLVEVEDGSGQAIWRVPGTPAIYLVATLEGDLRTVLPKGAPPPSQWRRSAS